MVLERKISDIRQKLVKYAVLFTTNYIRVTRPYQCNLSCMLHTSDSPHAQFYTTHLHIQKTMLAAFISSHFKPFTFKAHVSLPCSTTLREKKPLLIVEAVNFSRPVFTLATRLLEQLLSLLVTSPR